MARSAGEQNAWAPRIAALLALPLALYVLYAAGQKAVEGYHLSQRADGLRLEIQQLQQQNLRQQRELENQRSDVYVEQVAREQLGLVKPGDKAIVIVAPTAVSAPPITSAAQNQEKKRAQAIDGPMWKQWWRFFFGSAEG